MANSGMPNLMQLGLCTIVTLLLSSVAQGLEPAVPQSDVPELFADLGRTKVEMEVVAIAEVAREFALNQQDFDWGSIGEENNLYDALGNDVTDTVDAFTTQSSQSSYRFPLLENTNSLFPSGGPETTTRLGRTRTGVADGVWYWRTAQSAPEGDSTVQFVSGRNLPSETYDLEQEENNVVIAVDWPDPTPMAGLVIQLELKIEYTFPTTTELLVSLGDIDIPTSVDLNDVRGDNGTLKGMEGNIGDASLRILFTDHAPIAFLAGATSNDANFQVDPSVQLVYTIFKGSDQRENTEATINLILVVFAASPADPLIPASLPAQFTIDATLRAQSASSDGGPDGFVAIVVILALLCLVPVVCCALLICCILVVCFFALVCMVSIITGSGGLGVFRLSRARFGQKENWDIEMI